MQLGNSNTSVLSAPSSLLAQVLRGDGVDGRNGPYHRPGRGLCECAGHSGRAGKALVLPSSVIVAPNGQTTVTLEATEPAPASGLAVALVLERTGLAQTLLPCRYLQGRARQPSLSKADQSLGTTNLTATAAGYQPAATVLRVDAISLNTDPPRIL